MGTILDLAVLSVDPNLVDAKQLQECAIGQDARNDKTVQVCGRASAIGARRSARRRAAVCVV
jgi:hypothetical protein